MSKTVANNVWAELIHHANDGILELRWLPAKMTDGGFKATLALLALEAERLRPPFLLIDATEFRHEFGPGVMEWRDNCIIPRYGASGTKKFAVQMPDGFPDTIEAGARRAWKIRQFFRLHGSLSAKTRSTGLKKTDDL
jgi:hypothetical protein